MCCAERHAQDGAVIRPSPEDSPRTEDLSRVPFRPLETFGDCQKDVWAGGGSF